MKQKIPKLAIPGKVFSLCMTSDRHTTQCFKQLNYLVLLLLLVPFVSNAQTIEWNGNAKSLSIGNKLDILEDATKELSYDQIVTSQYQQKFKPSNSQILSLGYTESIFWLRFTINNTTNEEVMLELAQAGLHIADLYYSTNNGAVVRLKAGYQIPVDSKIIHNSFQVFPIPPGITSCYIKLNSNSEPIPVRLCSRNNYESESTKQKFSYGILLGLMIFVALYNLFLYNSLRKGLYLYYVLIVLTYIGYSAAVIDGFIVYFIPKVDLLFLYTTIPAIGIVLQTLYALVFLEIRKHSLVVFKVVIGIIAYFAIWMVAKFFFTFPVVQPINTVNALVSFFTMAIMGLYVGKKGSRVGYYFATAYFIYFTLVAVQAIYINTSKPEYLGGLSYVAYATLIEAFLLSFLLTWRFEWEKKDIENEKFEAQRKVIEKTQENEKIIQEQNIRLEREVFARTMQLQETNNELKVSNNRLIELNVYKESMTAMIVHDFKNLLNTVIAFSETQPSTRRLQSINSAGRYMHNLVMNILDVQKFESVKVKLAMGENSVEKVVNEAIEQLHFLIEQKTINTTFKHTEELHTSFDYGLILRVLVNILSNAIKYVDLNGNIEIRALRKDHHILLSIKDDGIGITADKIGLVFEKYTQFNTDLSGALRSTGLGLAFCKMAVEAHNGTIGVESEPNKGSDFFFTLPLLNSSNGYHHKKEITTKHTEYKTNLSPQENTILAHFIEELRKWEVYDFSEVKSISKQIALIDNINIKNWNEKLIKVLYSGNPEAFRNFIND